MKKFVFALILVYFFYIFVQAQEKNIIVTPEKMEGVTGTRWAFIAAVDDYAEVRGLNYTVNDALDLKKKLIELGFLEQNIVCLTSGAKFRDLPTKSNIEEQFAALLTRVGAGDMILVYLSGHGVEIKGEEGSFFCPPETDPKRLKETTVSITRMMNALNESGAKFKWMVVDACRNDPKNPEKSLFSDRDAGAKELESVMDPPEAVTLLQSCQPKKRSYEGGIGKAAKIHNGFFTLSLLEALSLAGDVNEDGEVTFSEVFQYVSRSTNEMAGRYYGEVQIPNLTGNVTDFVFFRDKNLPKAEKLASQAQSRLDAKDFEAASEQIDQALALCPRVRRFRDLKEKIEDAAPVVLREITVPTDVATLAEAYAKIAPQGTITLLRGRYKVPETITITKNVTIFGDVTHPEYVVLEGCETSVFHIQSGFAEIAGLTIQNEGKEGHLTLRTLWFGSPRPFVRSTTAFLPPVLGVVLSSIQRILRQTFSAVGSQLRSARLLHRFRRLRHVPRLYRQR